MYSNGVILTASRYRGKLNNNLIKLVNYQKLSSKNHHGLYDKYHDTTTTSALPMVTSTRLLYSAKQLNTLNKWYTTTGEIKPGRSTGARDVTEKEYYDMICELKDEQRTALSKALSLWEAEKVKGQLEGGKV